jgi:hypothetical protein
MQRVRLPILLAFLFCQFAAGAQTPAHSDSGFKVYSAYPSIAGADSATMYQVADEFVRQATNAADKLHAARLADIYTAPAGQNILSNVLISHHLNPNTTLDEFSARLQQLNVQVPGAPQYHAPSKRPSF